MPHPLKPLSLVVALAGSLSAAAPARAQQALTPTLTVAAVNATAASEAVRGTKRPDGAVRPGDVLRYTLTFTNRGTRPVRNVELRNPIPAGVHLVSGSARASRGDARLEFSADGGQSWAARPTETVTIDGRQVTRPVPVDRYTAIRWVVAGAVAPRGVVTGDFEARVGTPGQATAEQDRPRKTAGAGRQ